VRQLIDEKRRVIARHIKKMSKFGIDPEILFFFKNQEYKLAYKKKGQNKR